LTYCKEIIYFYVMRDFILLAKAISDETRLRMLKLLQNGPLCVCQITAVLNIGQPTVSKNLAMLRVAGLVDSKREGSWRFYFLTEERINDFNLEFIKLIKESLNDDKTIKADMIRCSDPTCKPENLASKSS